jgi:hypothetical protein
MIAWNRCSKKTCQAAIGIRSPGASSRRHRAFTSLPQFAATMEAHSFACRKLSVSVAKAHQVSGIPGDRADARSAAVVGTPVMIHMPGPASARNAQAD